ncbi:magnesium protoporphyrin IX methyltransferase [uncultured Pseudacidovorax sp.]|uniref:magnesium protoporphyrin IX methyltransferase n=1 Tax=uncultured Pseudacidovorax sp. TaxID=679313 RepID=UPI0025E5C96A|nr:magnesium protoporphyrin IX methyltransferase [uncultured Pseudacidovorax sp.]
MTIRPHAPSAPLQAHRPDADAPRDAYLRRRGEIQTYFDRTAAATWARLTSDAPVSRIRETVRAGRDRMRATLLSWLPHDLNGLRLLDAGCGTGALAMEAARRGAQVLAIDLSPTLVDLGRQRCRQEADAELLGERIVWRSGDMRAPDDGAFDHVVAMDSLIHYTPHDAAALLDGWAARVRHSLVFTVAPRTPLLAGMHAVGRLFPRGDRAPAIVPVGVEGLRRSLACRLPDWQQARTERIASGFYTSQACEMTRQRP